MSHQVVGFFEQPGDAEKVAAALASKGFEQDEIHILHRDDASSTTATTGNTQEEHGMWERIKAFFGSADDSDRAVYQEAYRRGTTAVAVDTDSDAEVEHATEVLQSFNATDLDERSHQWRAEGWTPTPQSTETLKADTSASTRTSALSTPVAALSTEDEQVLPIIEERLAVGKREVRAGGVRIYTRVVEEDVSEQVNLREEHVQVQRRAVDRQINPTDRAFEERAIEMTETKEVPVVQKEARVVEEVVINKTSDTRTDTVRDTLRHTDIEVEKVAAGQATKTSTENTTRRNP